MRAYGSAQHPIALAVMLCMILPLLVYLAKYGIWPLNCGWLNGCRMSGANGPNGISIPSRFAPGPALPKCLPSASANCKNKSGAASATQKLRAGMLHNARDQGIGPPKASTAIAKAKNITA